MALPVLGWPMQPLANPSGRRLAYHRVSAAQRELCANTLSAEGLSECVLAPGKHAPAAVCKGGSQRRKPQLVRGKPAKLLPTKPQPVNGGGALNDADDSSFA